MAASASHPHFQVIQAPAPLTPTPPTSKRLFLSGTITSHGDYKYWHDYIIHSISHLPLTILNPLREDWGWEEKTSDPRFTKQVNWELDALEAADLVFCYFDSPPPEPGKPEVLAPITMLELGLALAKGREKVVVCAMERYKKRGNVQIVCQKRGVVCLGSLEEVMGEIERRVGGRTS